MKSNENTVVYNTENDVANLNHVKGFNPLKYVRNTESGAVLDLPYKKLWFRLKHPNGIIRVLVKNFSDKTTAVEARVYFDRKDNEPVANSIITGILATDKNSVKQAQYSAIENALSDAGFGLQFLPANPSATNTAKKETKKVETKPKTKQEETVVTETKPPVKKIETETVETKITETPAKEDNSQTATDPLLSIVSSIGNSGVTVNKETGEVVDETPIATDGAAPTDDTAVNGESSETTTVKYDKTTPIDNIYNVISLDEAMNYVIDGGPYNGWVLSTLVERRPVKILEAIVEKYPVEDNILRAAVKKILDSKK